MNWFYVVTHPQGEGERTIWGCIFSASEKGARKKLVGRFGKDVRINRLHQQNKYVATCTICLNY